MADGILIGDAAVYEDTLSRLVLNSLIGPIAADVAAVGPDGALIGLVAVADGVGTVRMNLPAPAVASS